MVPGSSPVLATAAANMWTAGHSSTRAPVASSSSALSRAISASYSVKTRAARCAMALAAASYMMTPRSLASSASQASRAFRTSACGIAGNLLRLAVGELPGHVRHHGQHLVRALQLSRGGDVVLPAGVHLVHPGIERLQDAGHGMQVLDGETACRQRASALGRAVLHVRDRDHHRLAVAVLVPALSPLAESAALGGAQRHRGDGQVD